MNDITISWVPIDDVIPYDNNPRINDDAAQYVANSISEFGWQQAIVVDRNNVVIAGHTRLKAAKILGLDTVPVTVARNLTEEQANAYRLADNKTGEAATWHEQMLREELDKISTIDMTLFNFATLDGIDFETVPEIVEKPIHEVRKTFFLVCCTDDNVDLVRDAISDISQQIGGVEVDSTEKWYGKDS